VSVFIGSPLHEAVEQIGIDRALGPLGGSSGVVWHGPRGVEKFDALPNTSSSSSVLIFAMMASFRWPAEGRD
jgi:hypothetical protein